MRRSRAAVLEERAEALRPRPVVDPLAVRRRDPQPAALEEEMGHRLPPSMPQGGTRAEQEIASLLVARAAPASWLHTLIPCAGPGNCIVERARYLQSTNLHQIVVIPSAAVFFSDVVEKHRATFDRVILWVPEAEAEQEREYVLRAHELLGPEGKLVAALSEDLATDRGFRIWANTRNAVFEDQALNPCAPLREHGLRVVTMWRGAKR